MGDSRQIASVRKIVLDDGQERGVRALASPLAADSISGSWLTVRLTSGRSGTAATGGVAEPVGLCSPALHDPEGDGGQGFNRSFSGLLVTCGLEHIRQPAMADPCMDGCLYARPSDRPRSREVSGRAVPMLFCEGEVVEYRYGGEILRLRRRIGAPVGGRTLTIQDIVTNDGAQPTSHAPPLSHQPWLPRRLRSHGILSISANAA